MASHEPTGSETALTGSKAAPSAGPTPRAHATAAKADGAATLLRVSAAVGLVAFFALRLLPDLPTNIVDRALQLAVLVVTPLAFSLVRARSRVDAGLGWAIAGLTPVAAAAAIASLAGTGPGAAVLTGGWFGLGLLAGLRGLLRAALWWREGPSEEGGLVELARVAGLLFFVVGAAWLAAARLGLRFGYDPLIVALTAVHFHFAGLATASYAAEAIRRGRADDGTHRRVALLAVPGLIVAMPLVATGIAGLEAVGLVGAALLAVSVVAVAFLGLRVTFQHRGHVIVRGVRLVAALSPLLSMPLAVLWAYGQAQGTEPVELEWMLRLHGLANAHGFAALGLFGWVLRDREATAAQTSKSSKATSAMRSADSTSA
jgi:hypothetical protein